MSSACAPTNAEESRCFICLAGAIFGGPTRACFTFCQIENCRAQAARRHAQERSSAGLLHIVTMSSDGKDISRKRVGIVSVRHEN